MQRLLKKNHEHLQSDWMSGFDCLPCIELEKHVGISVQSFHICCYLKFDLETFISQVICHPSKEPYDMKTSEWNRKFVCQLYSNAIDYLTLFAYYKSQPGEP